MVLISFIVWTLFIEASRVVRDRVSFISFLYFDVIDLEIPHCSVHGVANR